MYDDGDQVIGGGMLQQGEGYEAAMIRIDARMGNRHDGGQIKATQFSAEHLSEAVGEVPQPGESIQVWYDAQTQKYFATGAGETE